ncbi:Serine 3-dehydrogenase [Mycobacterium basiliense]|uniref:Serine 3-dehydrogenase n=1 Tax=Mycobacterium basiliense TaxID=2094119 RepID=A0A447GHC0_9MYCO|nr:SDR family NAD(P)-dependent oxidoreductase [Mycobacterium basiliense]VDM89896.1 Serine 3-dehydrogenase [Mycobacterium basiliense]
MNCTRQHVVVTGASSGIGRATALRLAAAGWHVYASVRRTADGEALQAASPGGRLSPLLMDVTMADQIEAALRVVGEHVGDSGLDGLVDNAGIGVAWPVELVPLDALRRQLEVNVVGQIAVTQAFLPLLRRAVGRIVVIASIGDRFTPPFGGPLAASKAAIATLADALRQEAAPWGIRVVIVEPASINSGAADKLERDATRAIDDFGPHGAELYGASYSGMVKAALTRERRGSPPTVVADLVLKVLTVSRPRARNVIGKDSRMMAAASRWLPIPALDALRRKVFGLPKPGSLVTRKAT